MKKEPPKLLRVGLVKDMPTQGDLEGNFRRLETLVRSTAALRLRVQLFCTPECWLDGYLAAKKPGKRAMRRIAQEAGKSQYLRRAGLLARRMLLIPDDLPAVP